MSRLRIGNRFSTDLRLNLKVGFRLDFHNLLNTLRSASIQSPYIYSSYVLKSKTLIWFGVWGFAPIEGEALKLP